MWLFVEFEKRGRFWSLEIDPRSTPALPITFSRIDGGEVHGSEKLKKENRPTGERLAFGVHWANEIVAPPKTLPRVSNRIGHVMQKPARREGAFYPPEVRALWFLARSRVKFSLAPLLRESEKRSHCVRASALVCFLNQATARASRSGWILDRV